MPSKTVTDLLIPIEPKEIMSIGYTRTDSMIPMILRSKLSSNDYSSCKARKNHKDFRDPNNKNILNPASNRTYNFVLPGTFSNIFAQIPVSPGLTSLFTTAFAAITAPSPMVRPPIILAPA